MSRDAKATHGGVSWDELRQSYRGKRLYVLITPLPGVTGQNALTLKIVHLDRFASNTMLWVGGVTRSGERVGLLAHAGQKTDQPVTFELVP